MEKTLIDIKQGSFDFSRYLRQLYSLNDRSVRLEKDVNTANTSKGSQSTPQDSVEKGES